MTRLYDSVEDADRERYKRYCALTNTIENIDEMLAEFPLFASRIKNKLPLNAYPIFSFIFPVAIAQIGVTEKTIRCSTYSSVIHGNEEPDFIVRVVDGNVYLERGDGYVVDKAKLLEEFGQVVLNETMKLELLELRRITLLVAPDTVFDEMPITS